jgi:hypothetical protein
MDAAIGIGSLLLASLTGGSTAAITVERWATRLGKAGHYAYEAYSAITGAQDVIERLPGMLEEARVVTREGIAKEVSKIAGEAVDNVESFIESHPGVGKLLPGIGSKSIMDALAKGMQVADKLMDLATDNFTKGSKLLSAVANAVYRHGDVAERVTGFVLEHSGLFASRAPREGVPAMGPIQNSSGHGIDWVGKALTGEHAGSYLFFEVKGGLNGAAAGLSGEQSELASFARTRLERAFAQRGAWASRNTAAGTADFAQYVFEQMRGQRYSGFLFQHDNMRTAPSVRWKTW